MATKVESGAQLLELAKTNPSEFARVFATLLNDGNEPYGDEGRSAAGIFNRYRYTREVPETLGVTLKLEEREGGGEGEGEYVKRIFSFNLPGVEPVYLAVNGCYYSHDGTHWDAEFTRVYPREVLVTRYFTHPTEGRAV